MLDSATPKMKRYGVNDSDSFSDWLPNRRHGASATLWNISLTETLRTRSDYDNFGRSVTKKATNQTMPCFPTSPI